jgi:hypothetical protein
MKTIFTLLPALFVQLSIFSQTANELVFKNPVLLSGTALQDRAQYVFSNVTTGVDAVLEIKRRSDASVVVNNIDITNFGFDKALQPEMGIPGTAPANASWWVDFEISFFQAGYTTSNKKVELKSINVTGLDIDGDNQTLQEYAEMYEITTNTLSPTTVLLPTLLGTLPINTYSGKPEFDYKFLGPVTNFLNIDTNSVNVMATCLYEHKKKISFRLGAVNGASPTSAGLRMNSIWFKNFDLAPIITLPVKLASFSAMLNNDKVDLKWATASEKNVSHFSIEKSTDGINYKEAGLVFAYGNTTETMNYTFPDKNINTSKAGVIYYRLRSVDIDGKSELSFVTSVRIGKKHEQGINILTYPNPASTELRITIPTKWQGQKVSYELFNKNGQVAMKNIVGAGSQTESMNVNSLSPGLYIIKVICNGEMVQQKIIKR